MLSEPDPAAGWLRRLGTAGERRARLVCFPHAGASADAYLDLARALAPEIETVAVQYPGRQDRRDEEPLDTAQALADELAPMVRALADGTPYGLFGHSMGALVAYETARRIEREPGRQPVRLFVSGQMAPRLHEQRGDLPDDEGLVEEMRRLGTGEEVLGDAALLGMMLPVLRADYRVLRSYAWEPGPPLRVGITTLCGDADPLTSARDAEHWLPHSVVPGRVRVLPGGHFFVAEHVQEVAEIVRPDLLAPARSAAGLAR